jgi:hypothetical protein
LRKESPIMLLIGTDRFLTPTSTIGKEVVVLDAVA